MPLNSPLHRLLELARKRDLLNLALDKGALALGIVMGGVIALLLAGTDILNWYWLALLAVASLAAGAYLLRKSLASRYLLAQRIDRKLELKDAISTAFYFSEHPEPPKAAICASQFHEAENIAAQVNVKHALPLTRSRYLAPALALAAVAFGLFAARYLIAGSLDLKASLAQVVYDNFFSNKTEARNQLPPRAKFEPQAGKPNQETPSLEADRQPEDLLDSREQTDSANSNEDNSKTASQEGDKKKGDSSGTDKGKDDNSGKGNQAQDQKDQQQSSDAKNGEQKQGGQQGGKPSANQKNESLLNKVKDALSNMMDKMKQEASQGSKSDQAQQNNQSDKSPNQGDKNEKSKDDQSQASANGDQSQQAEGKQSSEANNDKKASDKTGSQDSKNGIGSEDGQKAIKQAEELQAMGKISEILGKRSAAVSGEVMVEVGSSKQQLKTPWAQTQASHSNTGGEIHRDEIPLTEQQFIERYFEEVHKPAATPPAAVDPASSSPAPAGSAPAGSAPAKKSGNG